MGDGMVDRAKDAEDFGFEELLEFGAVGDALAESAVAQVGDDDVGGGGTDVGGEESDLEVVE